MPRTGDGPEAGDLELLADAAAGDDAAFARLWPRIRVAALGQAYVWLGSGPAALDVVVDALAELLDAADLDELDESVPISAEVAAAVRDKSVEVLRVLSADGDGPPEGPAVPGGLPPAQEAALLDGLAGLPRAEREALWLVATLRLDPADAADVMADGGLDAQAVLDLADDGAEALEAAWAAAVGDDPDAADPVTLLRLLVPAGPDVGSLWERVERRRSGLDVVPEPVDAVPGTALAGAAAVGGAAVGAAAASLEPDHWAEDDDQPRTVAGAPLLLPDGDHVEPGRPRRRLLAAVAVALVVLVLAAVGAIALLRDRDADLLATDSAADRTTTSAPRSTTTSSSTTFPVPPTEVAPPTTVPSSSIAPVGPAPGRPTGGTATTRRPPTTRPAPVTTAPPPPASHTFSELRVATLDVGDPEEDAHRELVRLFGRSTSDLIVESTPVPGCEPIPTHREASWPGLRVAYIDGELAYWELRPGRTDLAAQPGDLRIGTGLDRVRAAGYEVDESTNTFRGDTTPDAAQLIYGEYDSGSRVTELSNWSHCGGNLFP